MPRVLVTGFEPFRGLPINPTQQMLGLLRGRPDVEVVTEVLPVVFRRCAEQAVAAVERVRPDVVVLTGLAAGRAVITPERIAINWLGSADDGADNAGVVAGGGRITPDGPDGLFTRLPIGEIVARLVGDGVPAEVSNTAGTYACNNVMYGVLDHLRRTGSATLAGFVHFPASDELGVEHPDWPHLPLQLMAGALDTVIDVCLAALAG